MFRASVISKNTSERAEVLCEWIWQDNGFLTELCCNRSFVDVTVFRNTATAAGATSVVLEQSSFSQGSAASSQGIVSAASSQGRKPFQISDTNRPCDTKSCTTLVPLQPAESESNNHEQRHPEFKKNWDQCRWRHTGAKWQKMAAFHHPVTGQLVSPLAEKPADIQGEWGVGCVLCGNFVESGGDGRGRANALAKFRVRGSTLQSSEIIRHCKSKLHSNALAALTAPGLQPAASTESDEKPEGYGVATCAVEHVPRSEKFSLGYHGLPLCGL
jgi:hypothetical protein